MLFSTGHKIEVFQSASLYFYSVSNSIKNAFTWLKAEMKRRCVTCFRDLAIHIIAVSRTLHSSNHNAFMVKKYRKWSFWELSNRFWRCNIVLSRRPPLYLYTAGHGPTDFINCDNSGMQMKNLKLWSSETACHDYINLHLYAFLYMAIFTHGMEKRLNELNFSNNNKFCNVFLNIVD